MRALINAPGATSTAIGESCFVHRYCTLGDERLSDSTGKNSRRATGVRDKAVASPRPKSNANANASDRHASRSQSTDVGKALRSVYDATLGERVPDDFLDLLGKLS